MVEPKMIRQPIVSILGHVDHGKTLLLDAVRGTAVASREAGGITQHIGASEVPAEAIRRVCGRLLERFRIELLVPGLLFIDTPGHEAFTNLRRRGGALADLAVLVVDIREGFMPQTLESVEILKSYRTPFMVAANKIDMIPGWQPKPASCFLDSVSSQRPEVQHALDGKVYEIVGKLHELGFESERFDRVTDFRRQVCIVPTSAKTVEGISEMLVVLAGLAQRFLEKQLMVEVTGPARGTVLEVREEVGLGKTLDVIIYDGTLSRGEMFAVAGIDKVVVSRVRAILRPKPMDEMRDPEDRFKPVNRVHAAAGVKVVAPDIESAVAGGPFQVVRSEEEAVGVWEEVRKELDRIRISSESGGVVLKADTLGSLEAIENQLRNRGIPIRRADIGDVSRRDVVEASAVLKSDPTLGVVLSFNVQVLPEAEVEAVREGISIIKETVIYKLMEEYEKWAAQKREEIREKRLSGYVRPAKILVKRGYVFRRSDPAIVGVDVLGGVLRPKAPLMRSDGRPVGTVREIQKERKSVTEASIGDELAISIDGPLVGRHFHEDDVLYTDIPRDHALALRRDLRDMLSGDEIAMLEEIISIKQRQDPTYGTM